MHKIKRFIPQRRLDNNLFLLREGQGDESLDASQTKLSQSLLSFHPYFNAE